MKKNFIYLIKALIFAVIALFTVYKVNAVMITKQFYDDTWPTTSTFTKFYDMKSNTVDVLFLGSSMTASAFNPQNLYDDCGITSYNLGSEQQNLLSSYYWIKEALKYQNPKAIVLDTSMVFEYDKSEPLNAKESNTRMAIDPMKWSSNKIDAVNDICKFDKNQKKLSYYFTNIRFHNRWTKLKEDDFSSKDLLSHYDLKGYAPLSGKCGNEAYCYTDGESDEIAKPVHVSKVFLDRIVKICEEENIALILVKTPSPNGHISKYNYMKKYANDNNVRYLDLFESSVCSEIGYDFPNEISLDGYHHNIWGAKKITDYIGNILKDEYGIQSEKSEQWELSRSYYNEVLEDANLNDYNSFDSFLSNAIRDRYTVFIALQDDGKYIIDEKILDSLKGLGLIGLHERKTVDESNIKPISYYAVIDVYGKQLFDECSVDEEYDISVQTEDGLAKNGIIRDGKTQYEISCKGDERFNSSSIKIDGTEYSPKKIGINVVVYSNDQKKVICSKSFE